MFPTTHKRRVLTSQSMFSLDDSVQRRRLDGFGQEVADGPQPQQLDAQGHLVQRGPEDLRGHMGLQSGRQKSQNTDLTLPIEIYMT